ncbi:MAG TPA: hypothetical protein VII94_04715 [Candidatus Saccharimonadales bacterium]
MCPCLPPVPSINFSTPGLPAPPGTGGFSLGALPSACGPVSFPLPSTSPSTIPGVGVGFSIPVPSISFPEGFPEDLLYILNLLQLTVPVGNFLPHLSLNFGKDIFDAILKLLDQFMPFLMLYKFFLPVLNLIICIIEVLCSLMNPFALVGALERLFTQCIPAFLNLFPIFAFIIMIISILLLILALIEYIINKICDLVFVLITNIIALVQAFEIGTTVGILAIVNKLASVMCIFQNIFVLLALFEIIITVIKDILGLVFAIPPCEGGSNSNCCAPQTCPAFIQNCPYTRNTGNLQYVSEVGIQTTLQISAGPPPVFFTIDSRPESWQLYDLQQNVVEAFRNIVDGYDVVEQYTADGYALPVPIFFPTTAVYTATTSPNQAAYTVDLKFDYNPTDWNRTGVSETIIFKNCIVLYAPTQNLESFDNQQIPISTGVFYLAGGSGYKSDGKTLIYGFKPDGIKPLPPTAANQATLGNFLHQAATYTASPVFTPPVNLSNVTYTVNPNMQVLLQANLITLGCEPNIAISRAFVNNVMFSQIASQTAALASLDFPNPAAAQACLTAACTTLRSNMTLAGVAQFQISASDCLTTLQDATKAALGSVIGIGFNPCESFFTLSQDIQFTTLPITISVTLNENSGVPLATNLPFDVGANLAAQIVAYPTFGTVGNFAYDGYKLFTAPLTSSVSGSGDIMIAFQNQILCTNILPDNGVAPSHTLQNKSYEFIYSPSSISGEERSNVTGEGDTLGIPFRDASDIAGDSD